MGAKGALPKFWAEIHPRFQTPANATIWTGILSVVWYVGLKLISENVYYDALTALGLMIAFYYGITGYASAIYYRQGAVPQRQGLRRDGRPAARRRPDPDMGVLCSRSSTSPSPLSSYTCTDPEDAATCAQLFGMGVPLALSIIFGILGVILLVIWRVRAPEFFRRRREVFQPELEAAGPAA